MAGEAAILEGSMKFDFDYAITALEVWAARSGDSPEDCELRGRYAREAKALASAHCLSGLEDRLTDVLLDASSALLNVRAFARSPELGSNTAAKKLARRVAEVCEALGDQQIKNRLIMADLQRRIPLESSGRIGDILEPPIKLTMPGLSFALHDLFELAQAAASLDGRASNGVEHAALKAALPPLIKFWRATSGGSDAQKVWEWGDKRTPLVGFLAHALSIAVRLTDEKDATVLEDDFDYEEDGAVKARTVTWLLSSQT